MAGQTPERSFISRRAFLWQILAVPAVLLITACRRAPTEEVTEVTAAAQPTGAPTITATDTTVPLATSEAIAPTAAAAETILPPTPACGDDDDDLTPEQTEGPFYTPNTPERTSLLEPGMAGTRILLTGTVLATNCQPVAGALLDFWHADDAGVYDNEGFRLRGHQFADDQGRYRLETIVPGLYPGRTRHFHVKVQAPNQPVLTTQLYFPGEPQNASDGIFSSELLMDVQGATDGPQATFDFVLGVSLSPVLSAVFLPQSHPHSVR
jgi:protocatechuate 3,4-dioxygenase beta subunit